MLIEAVLDNGRCVLKRIPEIGKGSFHSPDPRIMDLKAIAESMFSLELLLHDNNPAVKIKIPTYVSNSARLASILSELYEFLFSKSIDIEFVKNPQKLFSNKNVELKDGYTCLFSGGMDSVNGILTSFAHFGKKTEGCFTNHPDLKTEPLVRKLERKYLSKNHIKIFHIDSQRHHRNLQKTRGFLYILNASSLQNRNIIVPECGVTMYQPQFTLLDNVTMTTHPEVLSHSTMLLEEVLGEKINLCTPNENLTKAEIASTCPDKSALLDSCSCQGTTSFCTSGEPHCGSCYACVIRRIGMIVAGLNENSGYRNDVLLKPNPSSVQMDNVTAIAEFSAQYLRDPAKIRWYTKRIIEKYNKGELFRRFAEDFFAALYILRKDGKLSSRFLNKRLDDANSFIAAEALQSRIEEVRSAEHKPIFQSVESQRV